MAPPLISSNFLFKILYLEINFRLCAVVKLCRLELSLKFEVKSLSGYISLEVDRNWWKIRSLILGR